MAWVVRIVAAGTRAIEAEPMIPALDRVALQAPTAQRREPMRATIEQRGGSAVTRAKQHQRFLEERARDELPVCQLIGPRGDVPSVTQILHRLTRLQAQDARPVVANIVPWPDRG